MSDHLKHKGRPTDEIAFEKCKDDCTFMPKINRPRKSSISAVVGRKPLLYLDVNMGSGKQIRVTIYKDDDYTHVV